NPKAANLKGSAGSTPLMYAVLYGDSDSVQLLLKSGADPNIRNDAGATALMWAAYDPQKTSLLLEGGADSNARSDDGRTPVAIGASRFGNSAVVKLLLERGANPSAKSPSIFGDMTPLSEAAHAGDEAILRLLIARGADVKGAGFLPLVFATLSRSSCARCVDMLIQSASRDVLNMTMLFGAPPLGDTSTAKALLARGADVNAKDRAGRTILMLAASSDTLPVDTIKTLIDGGAEVNAKSANGQTALDFAKLRGKTPVVELLIKAGARESASTDAAVEPKPASSARAALERSIPLLQRTDVAFIRKSGCVSCHNNTLTAMTVAMARKNGLAVDDQTAQKQLKDIASYIDSWRERVLQGVGIPGDSDTISYILIGMAAENYPP
ncbi:MAG: ankyrin repeat domain-containing protein, partial [Gammaproteobacteria bacterium]